MLTIVIFKAVRARSRLLACCRRAVIEARDPSPFRWPEACTDCSERQNLSRSGTEPGVRHVRCRRFVPSRLGRLRQGLCIILVVMMHSTLGVEKATGEILLDA